MMCFRLVTVKKYLYFLVFVQMRLISCAAVDLTKNFSDAIVRGDRALVKRYISSKKVEVNGTDGEGNTFLHLAVRSQQGLSYEIIRLLCQAGADPNAVDSWGMTPLHHAAVIGKVPAMRILLENKAKVNVLDNDLSSPIHKSVVWQNRGTFELLRAGGAKLDLGRESVFFAMLRLVNR